MTEPTLTVLPAGSLPTKDLEGNAFKLKVNRIATELLEIPEVEVIYPDAFIKWHQATSVEDLMQKIKGTLFGRFGIIGYKVDATIPTIETGYIDISDVVFKD